jgi:glutathionylspermidine synthase
MKIDEQLEKEIATRLNLTKPVCPPDVAEYQTDGEIFRDAVSDYKRPEFSWRATTQEAKATIAQARKNLDTLEQIADKAESHSETVALAYVAYSQAIRDYWAKIEREESKPRDAFKQARDEFVLSMEKEIRSLKRKENKESWDTPERQAISDRLRLVQYMREEARFMEYNAETAPAFTELVLWEQIEQATYKANAFLNYFKETPTLNNTRKKGN